MFKPRSSMLSQRSPWETPDEAEQAILDSARVRGARGRGRTRRGDQQRGILIVPVQTLACFTHLQYSRLDNF